MTSKWHETSDEGRLDNLARKARRRGDAAEAAHWYRALALRLTAQDRFHAAIERRWRFNNDEARWERMQDELRTLRMYYNQHTDAIIRQKKEEASAPGPTNSP